MEREDEPPAMRETEDEVDVSLIRWMLSLSEDERLDVLQGFVDSVTELGRGDPTSGRSSDHDDGSALASGRGFIR
jgi:hypothetical protein